MTMTASIVQLAGRIPLRRALAVSILIIVSSILLGCQPLIEVVQPGVSPDPSGPIATAALATVAPDSRGLAIMGVDFDPPLEAGQLLATGGVTLLVALENQGQVVEPSVKVTARLLDPSAPAKAGDLASETVTVKSLAPGELRVVRFTQVTQLPILDRYKLLIEAPPLQGEREREDNVKIYDIIVRGVE